MYFLKTHGKVVCHILHKVHQNVVYTYYVLMGVLKMLRKLNT
jgi:hypothetical protein